jgi:hypothetical protein
MRLKKASVFSQFYKIILCDLKFHPNSCRTPYFYHTSFCR